MYLMNGFDPKTGKVYSHTVFGSRPITLAWAKRKAKIMAKKWSMVIDVYDETGYNGVVFTAYPGV